MAMEQGLVKAPPQILAKLNTWLKHCRQGAETNTTEWTRDGNTWLSNEGERRAILVSAAGMRRRLNETTTPITGAAPSRVKPVIKQPTAKRSKADEAPPARGKRESGHVELGASAAPPRKAPKRQVQMSSSEEEEEEEEEAEEEKDDDDEEEASDEEYDPIAQLEEQLAPLRKVIGPLLASVGSGASDEAGGSAPTGTGGAPGTAPTVPLLLPKPRSMCAALQLASHQRLGLSWLHTLHQHGYSGILADDMGLGKTVQTISLLAQLHDEGERGPHLVVCPTAVLENWRREFAKWSPALRVVKHHGAEAERLERLEALLEHRRRGAAAAVNDDDDDDDDDDDSVHVVLAAYSLFERDGEKPKRERSKLSALCASGYLVLDEAQLVKNAESGRYRNLARLKCARRLLLTGTPIENGPLELLALLSFVAPSLFSPQDEALTALFGRAAAAAPVGAPAGTVAPSTAAAAAAGSDGGVAARARIRGLAAPFVLRRLKHHVLLELPPKHEEVKHVQMPPTQAALYARTLEEIAASQQQQR